MRYKIKKNRHRPSWTWPAFLKGMGCKGTAYSIGYQVKFDESCKYNIPSEDQYDWNKLFGFCFGVFGIHKNSIRFGWRYNPKNDQIEIARIVYFNGQHIMTRMCGINVNEKHLFNISYQIEDNKIVARFRINNRIYEEFYPVPSACMRFGCGLYFGGNQKAPNTMYVEMDEV